MAEAGDGSGHTPLTPEWTPAPRATRGRETDRPELLHMFKVACKKFLDIMTIITLIYVPL